MICFVCRFFKHLRNVSLEGDLNKPNIEFTADGDLKSTELKIMNLRPSINSKNIVWEEVCRLKNHHPNYINLIMFILFRSVSGSHGPKRSNWTFVISSGRATLMLHHRVYPRSSI